MSIEEETIADLVKRMMAAKAEANELGTWVAAPSVETRKANRNLLAKHRVPMSDVRWLLQTAQARTPGVCLDAFQNCSDKVE